MFIAIACIYYENRQFIILRPVKFNEENLKRENQWLSTEKNGLKSTFGDYYLKIIEQLNEQDKEIR